MSNQQENPQQEPIEEAENTGQAAEETTAAPADTAEPNETEQLAKKYDELNDRYLRLMAEYDNFRKRSQKERDDIYPNATAAAVGKFLPVLDNIERAAAFPHADDDFGKGFDLIYQGFKDVLTAMGVEAIGEVGEPFNPELHNAVMHIEDESLGENVIAQVLQKGYRIGDKIVRYAMVQTAN